MDKQTQESLDRCREKVEWLMDQGCLPGYSGHGAIQKPCDCHLQEGVIIVGE
jgi:hypothetical protein